MRKVLNFLKTVLFFAIIVGLIFPLSGVLESKWTTGYRERYIARNLYELEENSLDVLILGSSQVCDGLSPVELYDHNGISSYTLGGSKLSVVSNYYWLREACKTQNPKVIVFDVSCLFETVESNYDQRMLDGMKLARNKLYLARRLAKTDKVSELKFLMPIYAYHSRWDELRALDFGIGDVGDDCFRGYNMATECEKGVDYETVLDDEDDAAEGRKMVSGQLSHFRKIVEWCQKNGKEVVLIKTPKSSWRGGDSAQVQELADEYGLEYLDFNRKALLEDIGYEVRTDMRDYDHLNAAGAIKLSDYMGDYLTSRFDLPDRRQDAGYDLQVNRERYETAKTDALLGMETDPIRWLDLLKQHSPCRIFVATDSDVGGMVPEEILNRLADLGLEMNINNLNSGDAYVGIVSNGMAMDERISKRTVHIRSKMEESEIPYEISNSNFGGDGYLWLTIDGKNVVLGGQGINIIVYDEANRNVVEAVSIDVQNDCVMNCITRGR